MRLGRAAAAAGGDWPDPARACACWQRPTGPTSCRAVAAGQGACLLTLVRWLGGFPDLARRRPVDPPATLLLLAGGRICVSTTPCSASGSEWVWAAAPAPVSCVMECHGRWRLDPVAAPQSAAVGSGGRAPRAVRNGRGGGGHPACGCGWPSVAACCWPMGVGGLVCSVAGGLICGPVSIPSSARWCPQCLRLRGYPWMHGVLAERTMVTPRAPHTPLGASLLDPMLPASGLRFWV